MKSREAKKNLPRLEISQENSKLSMKSWQAKKNLPRLEAGGPRASAGGESSWLPLSTRHNTPVISFLEQLMKSSPTISKDLLGVLTPEAKKPAPVAAIAVPSPVAPAKKASPAEDKKPITKRPMDVLASGLTYSLLSRVRNAFSAEARVDMEKGRPVLTLVDGRGQTQEISSGYVSLAERLTDGKLTGAAFLRTIRTSHVKSMLKAATAKKEEKKV